MAPVADPTGSQKIRESFLNRVSMLKMPCKRSEVSNVGLIYACLVWLFVMELVLSYWLYSYTTRVDQKCTSAIAAAQTNPFQDFQFHRRRKRNPPSVLEDNAVNPAGVASTEGANVEFFNPKLRPELEEKDGSKPGWKKGGPGPGPPPGAKEGETANDPWVWLTSYSRIPVR